MSEPIDFAIVGGGVAGTYVAWRLATSDQETFLRIAGKKKRSARLRIYEAERIGGRLLTVRFPRLPYKMELGGMRYTSRQVLVRNLVRMLRLVPENFTFADRLMYLRGYHVRPGVDPWPYRLGVPERGSGPGALVLYGMRCALAEVYFESGTSSESTRYVIEEKLSALRGPEALLSLGILTRSEWEVLKEHALLRSSRGAKLFEIGFWNLLQHYLSSEAFLLAHDGLGYESILTSWNAAEAIPWFLRDFQVDYHELPRGMEAIPEKLTEETEKVFPGAVKLKCSLKAIERVAEGTFLKLWFVGQSKPVLAKHVILAMPKAALQEITRTGFDERESAELARALGTVTGHPLFKLFLGYERAWWNDPRGLGKESGRVITDLPIRQVYYYGPDKADQTTDRGMVMASYSDAHYVDFWRPLHRRRGKESYYTLNEVMSVKEQKKADTLRDRYGVTANMALKAHRQVALLHPELTIPEPYVAMVKEWPEGWHTWNVHEQAWLVMRSVGRPFRAANLYICGEAYSPEQGWVEGALRSAERALSRIGLPEPDWIENPRLDGTDNELGTYEEYIGG